MIFRQTSRVTQRRRTAQTQHARNRVRVGKTATGAVMTSSGARGTGIINDRARSQWHSTMVFTGPFLCEHPDGDGLSVVAANRAYARRILPANREPPMTNIFVSGGFAPLPFSLTA